MKIYIGTGWGLLCILYAWGVEQQMFSAHRDGATWMQLIQIVLGTVLMLAMAVIGIARDDRNKWDKDKDL